MDNTLTSIQSSLLATLGKSESVKDWYLAGGTALNIQLGHRQSIDFDFFSEKQVNMEKVLEGLSRDIHVEVTGMEPGTLHVKIEGVQISFFEYRYKVLEKRQFQGIAMASLKDIGLMKILAIQQRGLRKDFIDLYAICRTGMTLPGLMGLLLEKYPNITFDTVALLKALCYFGDAVDDVPLLTHDIDWENVKKYFQTEVRVFFP
ncbi:MAG: hypothetical protein A2268_00780 [Candidatus Raymondbacteria bacterium RifOxyA12_full_50_37]|uniref:Nucleotidyltransferase n=1 Tax=Candidatus Raymondbacteria bacterium RIFOXYD12_FULL_49_13 TaxID=1817890 RepID=A0A1F7F226_UNCRA|nr:MAG: hypothetical protein A2268_00780 [Candidatus Raymondbacteria bacterium RifOxyA12_full_50_37]OGJ90064.1 MAG: hypothetical protein A2248_19110 [Candidatus Raymondbacteria bacterium RIFOXYA2_FULL_49_16]OGJ92881.1 MAG: hypothetical protein A2487_09675 [Candidatus Raymondbacteria bacterium RifOxyC12_full_50_8]OGJ96705.1 MAG: hypothetical protein A2350_01965 [Candidatus Raymondbacteria bacterium RifOxyB12_full_50_8]OGJ96748.1 MAG: hypothetical protein A2453_06235 [Candidatus Raymondbacteria b